MSKYDQAAFKIMQARTDAATQLFAAVDKFALFCVHPDDQYAFHEAVGRVVAQQIHDRPKLFTDDERYLFKIVFYKAQHSLWTHARGDREAADSIYRSAVEPHITDVEMLAELVLTINDDGPIARALGLADDDMVESISAAELEQITAALIKPEVAALLTAWNENGGPDLSPGVVALSFQQLEGDFPIAVLNAIGQPYVPFDDDDAEAATSPAATA